MSVVELNNLYDNIQSKNNDSENIDLNRRIKNLMILIEKASNDGKRKLIFDYIEDDIRALLHKTKFHCETRHYKNGEFHYEISW